MLLNRTVLSILLLLGYAVPSVYIAVYLERTYYIDIGLVLSILIMFVLAFFCHFLDLRHIFYLGNLLMFIGSLLFEEWLNFMHFLHCQSMGAMCVLFYSCWFIPQIFGMIWGKVLHRNLHSETN
jgi:hypothetical protein